MYFAEYARKKTLLVWILLFVFIIGYGGVASAINALVAGAKLIKHRKSAVWVVVLSALGLAMIVGSAVFTNIGLIRLYNDFDSPGNVVKFVFIALTFFYLVFLPGDIALLVIYLSMSGREKLKEVKEKAAFIEDKEIVKTIILLSQSGEAEYIGLRILTFFLKILIVTKPLADCMQEKYYTNHTVVDGRRLKFDGRALELFGNRILWGLLTVVTLGIFYFFVPIRVEKWKAKHTSIAGGSSTVESKFDGWLIQYLGWKLLGKLITVITLGIAYPAAMCMIMSWQTKHCVYNGYRLNFDGHGVQLLGRWMLWWLLCIVTLGIYAFFIPVKREQWKAKHIHIKENALPEPAQAEERNDNM